VQPASSAAKGCVARAARLIQAQVAGLRWVEASSAEETRLVAARPPAEAPRLAEAAQMAVALSVAVLRRAAEWLAAERPAAEQPAAEQPAPFK
jgi:hypothetical protein